MKDTSLNDPVIGDILGIIARMELSSMDSLAGGVGSEIEKAIRPGRLLSNSAQDLIALVMDS
jgi:hypothetical protein